MTTIALAAGWCLLHIESRTAALESSGPPAQHKPAPEEATAEQVYKNIQVLKGLPASELDGVMEFMSAALGVGCFHCHTEAWEGDSKSAKVGTRRMILMTRAINNENFSGNPAVTCYTCHQGQPRTVPLPPMGLASATSSEGEAPTPRPEGLPSTDAIIDRYIHAIGGEAAIDKMKTRVLRGTETATDRMTAPEKSPIEIYQTHDNELLIIRDSNRSILQGFDGVLGWISDSRGIREMDSKELVVARRDADFYRYLKIRETYPQMRVLAKERIGDREAYVVGATSRDESREKLYFDAKTGLLIRKHVTFRTAFGGIPEVTDFDDYRAVNEIKLPFTIKWSRPPFGFVRRFSEIRVNAAIDAAKFRPRTK